MTDMILIRPVILCGGSGTRLWPLSRRLEPKQFQKLLGDSTLFQDTIARFARPPFGRPVVLANRDQEARVRLEIAQAGNGCARPDIIVEPAMRSTAPAIAAAALLLARDDPDATMLVAPSDHRVGKPEVLVEAIVAATAFVATGGIALFGIEPTSPETGFGYIRAGEPVSGAVNRVEAFIEKPGIDLARQLTADGRHTWNSGIFMFRADTILAEFREHAADLLDCVENALRTAERVGNATWLGSAFGAAREISIDHAVMERSRRLGVVPVAAEWDDLGSFEALWRATCQDTEENVVIGDVILKGVRRSYIRADARTVAVSGLSNIVVIATDDAVLVTSRAHSQDVKHIAQQLAGAGHPAADRHVASRHAGGTSRLIDEDAGCRTLQVTVLPQETFELGYEAGAVARQIVVLGGAVTISAAERRQEVTTGQAVRWPGGETLTVFNPAERPARLLSCTFLSTRDGDEALRKEAV